MLRISCVLSFIASFVYSQWQMFSDTKDTYLYNTQTGEIYIRYHQKGNQSYQDVFIKMPRGMTPQEFLNQNQAHETEANNKKNGDSNSKTQNDPLLDSKLESLKKSQEMMNEALKGTF